MSTHYVPLTVGETTSRTSPLLNYAITESTQESETPRLSPSLDQGRTTSKYMHGASVWFPGFSKSTLLRKVMAKENTFLPLHTGEASAETLQSLVNNTTNQDRDPYLS